ncbi:sugar phosphate isomerase/epimerase family protein [Paenibacillus sp. JDR-2]|uniref:sugar phosphate isomerase/epimerase family protein n=1 Tax=Paenibacillus sp. (strain JDR-2) TaxID=324057 RepID=UPI00016647AE|nr:TIM barrel protein [Paenibacillus sp. JDR-2]ACT03734.1 Xylose isomerase domain protein TIM barrel [Paenibacillus sp. JDR-2]
MKESLDPKLDVQMSWWGMSGLAAAKGRSVEEQVEMIAEAGFDGINGFIPAPQDEEKWRRLLESYDLSFSVNAYPKTAQDMDQFLTRAKEYGGIQHINAQVLTPFLINEPAVQLLSSMDALSRHAGIPLFIETHRGTITQDLLRTVDYIKALQSLRLTIDLSHYVVAGELHTISDEAEQLIQTVLTRSAAFHARVSNGEQVQIDVGNNGEHPMLRHFERWWSSGMKNWQSKAGAGDVLPFVVELGPPSYAITTDEYDGRNHEISDRWEQSKFFMRTARRLWSEIGK